MIFSGQFAERGAATLPTSLSRQQPRRPRAPPVAPVVRVLGVEAALRRRAPVPSASWLASSPGQAPDASACLRRRGCYFDGGWQTIALRFARGEESPNTTRQHAAQRARGCPAQAGQDGQCHRKQTAQLLAASRWVRVKRRGKSPPPAERSTGHEKPHAVQGRTGDAGRLARRRPQGWRPSPGISRTSAPRGSTAARLGGLREMIVALGPARVRANRIRLIATQLGALSQGRAPTFFNAELGTGKCSRAARPGQ
jgi:hypothetical protein